MRKKLNSFARSFRPVYSIFSKRSFRSFSAALLLLLLLSTAPSASEGGAQASDSDALGGGPRVEAQFVARWTGTTGNWNFGDNWSTGLAPNNGSNTYLVWIDDGQTTAPSVVTLDMTATIDGLVIDAGDSLIHSNAYTLNIGSGGLQNNGSYSLNSTGASTVLTLLNGAEISGGGTIILSDFSNNHIQTNATSVTLWEGATIRGAGRILNNSGGMTNRGAIIAEGANKPLVIDPSNLGFVNEGLLRANGAGGLVLENGTFTNFGTALDVAHGSYLSFNSSTYHASGIQINQLGDSPVTIYNSTLNDATLQATTATTVRFTGSTSNLKNFSTNAEVLQNTGTHVVSDGALTFSGDWRMNSIGNPTSLRFLNSGGPVGGGTIWMTDYSQNEFSLIDGTSITVAQDVTIRGAGAILNNTGGMINRGTIIAEGTNNPLIIQPNGLGFVNEGTLRADGAGGLTLTTDYFTNLGDPLVVADGSSLAISVTTLNANSIPINLLGDSPVTIDGSTLNNATIQATTGTTVRFAGSASNLTGFSTNAEVRQNSGTHVAADGVLTFSGDWYMDSIGNPTSLRFLNSGGPAGGGTIWMTDYSQNEFSLIDGTSITVAQGVTVRGAGAILNNTGGMINRGTIIAEGTNNPLIIDPNGLGFVNEGTLRADGAGGLTLNSDYFTNLGDPLVVADGSSLAISGATLNANGIPINMLGDSSMAIVVSSLNNTRIHGTTTNTISFTGGTSNVSDFSTSATVNLPDASTVVSDGLLTLSGDWFMNGVSWGAYLNFLNNGGLAGGGTIWMGNDTANYITSVDGTSVTVAQNTTIRGAGSILNDTGGMVNHGAIIAEGSYPLIIDPGALGFVNEGTVRAAGTPGLLLKNGNFTNLGNPLELTDGSKLEFNNATFNANGISINMLGDSSMNVVKSTLNNTRVYGTTTNTIAFTGGTSNVADFSTSATVSIADASTVVSDGPLTFSGDWFMNGTSSWGAYLNFLNNGGLAGGGTIWMGNDTANYITSVDGTSITVAQNTTIRGAGSILNGTGGMVNHGAIIAEGNYPLILDPNALGFVNEGTVRAAGTPGLLLKNGNFTNLGNPLELTDGSKLEFNNATFNANGISINMLGDSSMNVVKSTLNNTRVYGTTTNTIAFTGGTSNVADFSTSATVSIADASTVVSDGPLTFSGDWFINGAPSWGAYLNFLNSGGLAGGGTIRMRNDPSNYITSVDGTSVTVAQNTTIRGAGSIMNNTGGMVNHGAIIAEGSYPLILDPNALGFVNEGIMRAVGSAGLDLFSGNFTNLGNALEVADGSSLKIESSTFNANGIPINMLGDSSLTIVGSTLNNTRVHGTTTNTISFTSSSNVADFSTSATVSQANASTVVSNGPLTFSGDWFMNSTGWGAFLNFQNNGVLIGGGTVRMGGHPSNNINSNDGTSITVASDTSIRGFGNVLNNTGGMVNLGAIIAEGVYPLIVDPSALGFVNEGTMRASGVGGLTLLNGNFINTGHTIDVLDDSLLTIESASVTGGNIAVAQTGEAQFKGTPSLRDVLCSGTITQPNFANVSIANSLTLNGTWRINAAANRTYLTMKENAMLSGAGEFVLSNSPLNYIQADSTSVTLGNGLTIRGAGQLLNSSGGMINRGTIVAQGTYPLVIDPNGLGFVNEGTLSASGGGKLSLLNGSFISTGHAINVLDGSRLMMEGASVTGGDITVAKTGEAKFKATSSLRDVLCSGTITQPDLTAVNIAHSLSLNGTWEMNSTGNPTYLYLNENAALSGVGEFNLSNSTANYVRADGTSVTLGNGLTIRGAGSVLQNTGGMINRGTIDASGAYPLIIAPNALGFVNEGLLRASGPARLTLLNGTFINTDHTIDVLNGSLLMIEGASIIGGNITVAQTGTARFKGSSYLRDVLCSGTITQPDFTVVNIANSLALNGTWRMNAAANPTNLIMGENTVLSGAGEFVLSDSPANYIKTDGTSLTLGNELTIRGAGTVLQDTSGMINHGAIIAEGTNYPLIIDPNALGFVNEGTLRASGPAGLTLFKGAFINTGHTIDVLADSLLLIDAASVVGGNITVAQGGETRFKNTSYLRDVLCSGTITQPDFTVVNIANSLTLNGTWRMNAAANPTNLIMNENTALSGVGEFVLSDSPANYIKTDGTSVTLGNRLTIRGAGAVLQNSGGMINRGAIIADKSNSLIIDPNALGFLNEGVLRAASGSPLRVQASAAEFLNYNDGTLTGGAFETSGTLQIDAGIIAVNAASLLLDGPGGVFRDGASDDAMASLSENSATGTLTLKNLAQQTINGSLTNRGAIDLRSSSTLSVAGNFTQLQGATRLDNGFLATGGLAEFSAGELTGNGALLTSATNLGARVAINGPLVIQGNYRQTSGSLEILVAGADATSRGLLQVSGLADLGADIRVVMTDGFAPSENDVYELINCGSRSGEFARVTCEGLPAGMKFRLIYEQDSVSITFTSATSYVLTALAENGAIQRDPDLATYAAGTTVTLTAAPDEGYHFVSWSGDAPAGRESENPLLLTMDGDKTVTAHFERDTGTVDIVTSPPEATWSLLGPDGLTISDRGTTTLLDMPTGSYTIEWQALDHWNPPDPATTTLTLTRDDFTTFSGIYTIQTHTLSITTANGSVSKSPDLAAYDYGSTVSLTATPNAGHHFVRWSGDAPAGKERENPVVLLMDKDMTLTATFAVTTHTLTVNVSGNGSVAKNPDLTFYAEGSTVSLTATPNAGHHFVRWSGDAPAGKEQENPVVLLVEKNMSLTATFAVTTHTLTVNVSGNGSVAKNPDLTFYAEGSTVSLTATPNAGHHFVRWSGDAPTGKEQENPIVLLVDKEMSLTATFAVTTHTLTVNVNGNGSVAKNPNLTFYAEGSTVSLTATPDAEHHFVSWSGDAVGTTNPLTLTITNNTSVTANFAIDFIEPTTGTLVIEVTPPNAPWTIIGPEGSESGVGPTSKTMVTGQYTITWNALPGWIEPSWATPPAILAAGETILFSAVYERFTEGVAIEVTPETGAWLLVDSNQTSHTGIGDGYVPNFPTGPFSLTWNDLANYDLPEPPIVTGTFLAGELTTITGVYTRHVGNVTIDVTPPSATWTLIDGDGTTMTGTGNTTLTSVSTGLITLVWGALEDYYSPDEIAPERDLGKGLTVIFTTTYLIREPAPPFAPGPNVGEVDVSLATMLQWTAGARTEWHDVYLWKNDASKPITPTASTIGEEYDPPVDLDGGTTYSWQVVSKNTSGETAGEEWWFSTRSDETPPPAMSPTNVMASDGAFPDKILVTWSDGELTEPTLGTAPLYFRVYRSTSASGPREKLGLWQTEISYADSQITTSTAYYYWVKASSNNIGDRASDLSAYDTGWMRAASDLKPYQITYKNCELKVGNDSTLRFRTEAVSRIRAAAGGKSTVKIKELKSIPPDANNAPGVKFVMAASIPEVTIIGDISKLYTEAPTRTLRIDGELKKLTLKGAYAERLTAGAIGFVKMSAPPRAFSEIADAPQTLNETPVDITGPIATTIIRSLDFSSFRRSRIILKGVVLREFSAPGQKVDSMTVMSQKMRDETDGSIYLNYGAMEGGRIEAQNIKLISCKGGAIRSTEIIGFSRNKPMKINAKIGIFTLDRLGVKIADVRAGDLSPGLINVPAPALSLSATGGDMMPKIILASDQIKKMSAKFKKLRFEGAQRYYGGQFGMAQWNEAGEVLNRTTSTLVISGMDPFTTEADIRLIQGAKGVRGIFMAGGFISPGSLHGWEPNLEGAILKIKTKIPKPGQYAIPKILGTGWSNKAIKYTPKGKPPDFIEYNQIPNN